ncbi:hypothetical protein PAPPERLAPAPP_04980 [Brevundimonas phage vB_BpoS-Papperlapapp]|uniref:Uncharacterized protein n=1 Tax=Brevundimonas phage vB_BpoS-Domovoi TaxID=2948598 RepID=A0A9E7MRP8_9CAUD|nr:hypothetical protein DOMOVOI_03930 [Brevundimonas phage vB_BpoS-Domovoi]USN16239.1 hypothetical protein PAPPERLAPAPP_04980 [Brevundimonas phage vB_BpoS-Papperlapapp]
MNWIMNGQDPDAPRGPCRRRYLPIALAAAAALSGCKGVAEEIHAVGLQARDDLIAGNTYHYDPRVNLCFAVGAYARTGNFTDNLTQTYVPCTDEVMAQALKDAP